jgi:hypothetical protein
MAVADHALLSSSMRGNRHAAAASARGPWPHSLACVPLAGRSKAALKDDSANTVSVYLARVLTWSAEGDPVRLHPSRQR